MDEQELLGEQVRQWALEGRWIDRGRWERVRNGTLEYYPRVDVTGAGWEAHLLCVDGGNLVFEETA